jgi:hypothetical protein
MRAASQSSVRPVPAGPDRTRALPRPAWAARSADLDGRLRALAADQRRRDDGRAGGQRRVGAERLERRQGFGGAGGAALRVLVEQAGDEARQRGVDAGRDAVQRLGDHADVARDGRRGGPGQKRVLARQRLVEDDAERVQVGARVVGGAAGALGRQVGGRAADGAGVALERQAEVDEVRRGGLAAVDEDIAGLQVAVGQAVALQIDQRAQHLQHRARRGLGPARRPTAARRPRAPS